MVAFHDDGKVDVCRLRLNRYDSDPQIRSARRRRNGIM